MPTEFSDGAGNAFGFYEMLCGYFFSWLPQKDNGLFSMTTPNIIRVTPCLRLPNKLVSIHYLKIFEKYGPRLFPKRDKLFHILHFGAVILEYTDDQSLHRRPEMVYGVSYSVARDLEEPIVTATIHTDSWTTATTTMGIDAQLNVLQNSVLTLLCFASYSVLWHKENQEVPCVILFVKSVP